MAVNFEGGYNCQFVVVPPQELQTECAICLHVVREPYLVSCCGYRFCRVCIENVEAEAKKKWSFARADCPLCKKKFTTVPDKLLERTLNQKTVYCQNKDLGCKWVNKLSQLDEHLNTSCRFVQVGCTYCSKLIERYEIENHESNCPQRPVTCTYCNKYTAPNEEVCRHWDKCPSFPVSCEACGKTCKRIGIKDHIAKSCPRTQVKCKYWDIGCQTQVCRMDITKHMEDSAVFHVTILDNQCEKLKSEQQEMREQVKELHETIDIIVEKSLQLKQEASEHKDPVSVLHVSNCPPTTNEQKLGSLFGQHGLVRRIEWDPEMNHAFIYYNDNECVQKALIKDAGPGIRLHKTKLCIHEVEPIANLV